MTFDLLLTLSIRDREVVGSNPIAPTSKFKQLAEAPASAFSFTPPYAPMPGDVGRQAG